MTHLPAHIVASLHAKTREAREALAAARLFADAAAMLYPEHGTPAAFAKELFQMEERTADLTGEARPARRASVLRVQLVNTHA